MAGLWDWEDKPDQLVVKAAFSHPQPRATWAEFTAQAERLSAAIHREDAPELKILECSPPPTLVGASNNHFQFSLRDLPGKAIKAKPLTLDYD